MTSHNWFSTAEVAALFAALDSPWWKAFLAMGIDVGLRPTEALNICWNDIDAVTQSVRIAPRGDGEHRAPDGSLSPIFAFCPSLASTRTIPVSRKTIEILQRWRCLAKDGSPYVFVPADTLYRLLPRLGAGNSPSTEHLAPGLSEVFALAQRRARAELARQREQPLAATPWNRRTLAALRNTFAYGAAKSMPPSALAAHLGFARRTPVLAYYDQCALQEGGAP